MQIFVFQKRGPREIADEAFPGVTLTGFEQFIPVVQSSIATEQESFDVSLSQFIINGPVFRTVNDDGAVPAVSLTGFLFIAPISRTVTDDGATPTVSFTGFVQFVPVIDTQTEDTPNTAVSLSGFVKT